MTSFVRKSYFDNSERYTFDTVDGSEFRRTSGGWQFIPLFTRLYIPAGPGFLPSTVWFTKMIFQVDDHIYPRAVQVRISARWFQNV